VSGGADGLPFFSAVCEEEEEEEEEKAVVKQLKLSAWLFFFY